MGAIQNLPVRLESITCASCGVEFAMPAHLLDQRRDNGGQVFCPSGHTNHWGKTLADRLKAQLAEKERDLVFQKSQREAETKRAEAATERALKAERKVQRAEAGVCTKCNRTFKQLAAHMKSKHAHEHAPTKKAARK